VSSNGVLFLGTACSTSFGNTTLPSGISSDPFVAFFWDDMNDYGAGEFIEHTTFGAAGGRVFYLFVRNRLLTSACGSDPQTAVIAVHEASGLISVTYQGFSGCGAIRGSSATIGMQGPGGASASLVSLVSTNVPLLDDNAPRQTISFQPPL